MKGKKLISALLLLGIVGTATTAVTLAACKKKPNNSGSSGNTYYVSVNGKSTQEAAGTKDDPWDVAEALSKPDLQPGDTVRVMPGVYNLESRINVVSSGTYDKYVNFVADDPTKETVLSFYQMSFRSTNRGVEVYSYYMHWDGIDIRGAGDNGMYIGGSYNIIENARFYDNRDTGLQLGRSYSPTNDSYKEYNDIKMWPSYNLIKNCTSFNNYDNETYGENADGFAAKLTIGYGNVFDGCIAYRNSDDGWDLFAKTDSGNIGEVIIYNCVAFENGFILDTQEEFNKKCNFNEAYAETNTKVHTTRDGDGNGFKLGGSVMEGEVLLHNVLAYNNRMHGITDNSNPGVIIVDGATCYNNGAVLDANGNISYEKSDEATESANIDLARHTYSYNHVANALAVNNGNKNMDNDAYRGTVENTTFSMASDSIAYLVEGQAEYNSKNGDRGQQITPTAATELFKELPANDMGLKRNNDKSWYDWHTALRNEDGSINMGDILALKNANATQGSKLNLSSWDAYDHYGLYNFSDCGDDDEAVAQAVIDMTYVPIRPEALYQSFNVITRIQGVEISWTSSNNSLLKVITDGNPKSSNSNHQARTVEVTRPDDKDTKVTLTAKVTVGEAVRERKFEINVKRNTYRVAESGILIEDLVGDNIIKDKGDNKNAFFYATPVVLNDTSDSGAVINSDNYDRVDTVKYKAYGDSGDFKTKSWDASVPGIWQITERITLHDNVQLAKKGDGSLNADGSEMLADKTITKIYYIYIAEESASNGFENDASTFAVNKDGFVISGTFMSPTGTLYAVTKSTSDAAPANADAIKNDPDVQKHAFRTTGGDFQFAQKNSGAYNIYYFVESADESQASKVYTANVGVKYIASKADFEAMLKSNDTSTLYLQTGDIDMSGSISLVSTSSPFIGVFNGNGYKLYNISIDQGSSTGTFGLFTRVKGGTIMNVTFENVVINSNTASTKIGLIGEMMGGYIYNVYLHNIDVNASAATGAQRVGGLIGQITTDGAKESVTYIQNVSLVSDATRDKLNNEPIEYAHVIRGNARVGGLVGFVQGGGSSQGWCKLYVDNCYVDAQVESVDYGGGIIGRFDDNNKNGYVLEMTRCYFAGFNHTQKYNGGILGGFTGGGTVKLISCVSTGKLFYTLEQEELTAAVKNGSHMVGSFAANADATVTNCFAPFIDYNANYLVTAFDTWDDVLEDNFPDANSKTFWTNYLTYEHGDTMFSTAWDFESVWEFEETINAYSQSLKAPYVHLVIKGQAA